MARSIGELLNGAGIPASALRGQPSTVVAAIELDSRLVEPGALFCCLRGTHTDGHHFAAAAVSSGARALLVDHVVAFGEDAAVAQIVVPDTRRAMGALASAFHGHPSRKLTMVGVTGTNGKTTTASLIASVLRHAGVPTGTIGTLTGLHTTPESPHLQLQLASFVAAGTSAVVMEVSSHALALDRVVGCHFDVAVFTNLGRDHLDLHGTVEAYFAAKARLFDGDLSVRGVVNVDDVHGRLLRDAAAIPIETFSLVDAANLRVSATEHSYTWRGERIAVRLGASFNVMNSLAAATACASLGLTPEQIAAGLAAAPAIAGRFEAVRAGQPFDVIVDFAHTPDGLRQALLAARPVDASRQLTVVFGCGGDRDRAKRPLMGALAAELADRVVVTSDNPRSEDPHAIIDAIVAGVPADYRDRVVIEPDRRMAIAAALAGAASGDVVLIAGKGHETTQTVGERVLVFDDRVVTLELIGAVS